MSNANNFHVRGDDKYTRSVECIVFMITNGSFPANHEMTTDEYGLRSMTDIDPADLRMSSRQWELQGLVPSDVREPSGRGYYPRSVYDTCRIHQILLRRILHGRINRTEWIIGQDAWDSTMFHYDSESMCSGH